MSVLPQRHPSARLVALAFLVWAVLLALVLVLPSLTASPTAGDDLTRHTVRLSLLYYAAALTLMLRLRPHECLGKSGWGPLARWCWTLAWAAFFVHLAMAFQYVHHWSHEDAVRHTREVSGLGEGVYISDLFALLWTADVAAWWLRPAWYARRSPWVGRILHGFMLFIVFNATIVYETGLIRWAGVALFAWLAAVWATGRLRLRGER
ncbi:MAG TPA: hypothetical protein VKA46_07460 [Gemmataceae bacterium]|nr:hypothetical protein [Gemmataceae bacterium]